MNLFQLANENRSGIVKAYSFHSGLTQKECAEKLTETAISEGFVQYRDSIPGATLADWSIRNKAPAWACKSALLHLMSLQWTPSTVNEWAVFGYLFVQAHSLKSLDKAQEILPSHLPLETALGWVSAAIESNTAFELSKELKK